MERHLAAILSADVAGYSRLVEDDDEATIRTLQRYREIMRTTIDSHQGRVVDAPGDNLLAEFPSVIEAVRAAVEIQQSLTTENTEIAAHRRMLFRIGISVGDIVVEDKQLFGDGVNIAARVEALADPGGICLSSSAYEQCENKVGLNFEFIGEQSVKNFSKPVSVWKAILNTADTQTEAGNRGTAVTDSKPRSLPRRAGVMAAAVFLLLGALAYVTFRGEAPVVDVRTTANTSGPGNIAQTNERPAIIVLPFENLSDDPGQVYFSNGITEDITTDLSKIDSIFVVPSREAKRFKGKAIETSALREEFGIRYLLEGSVRKAGDQVRISARLIDVVDDRHLWSERFDRPMTDIFALQDDIRTKIFTALRVSLTDEEQQRFVRAPTNNLVAYDYYLRAQDMTQRARREFKPGLMDEAAALYQQAIDLDPNYAAAYGALGLNRRLAWFYGWSEQTDASVESMLTLTEKAVALDDANPHLIQYTVSGRLFSGDYDGALKAAAEYVRRLPNDPEAQRMLSYVLAFAGKYEEAAESADRAVELYPRFPVWGYWSLGLVYNAVGRTDEALELLKSATTRAPNYLTNQLMLTILYSNLGYEDEARAQAKEILRISPDYRADTTPKMFAFKDTAVSEMFITALRKAGIP